MLRAGLDSYSVLCCVRIKHMLVNCMGAIHRHIKFSLDNLRPIKAAEAFESVGWLHQQT